MIDTNVIVSAFLKPSSVPSEVLRHALDGALTAIYDDRILNEYKDVLSRSKFAFDTTDVSTVLRLLTSNGECLVAAPVAVNLADADDLPFLEVAIAGNVDALITGNVRHFPVDAGVPILTPRKLLQRLGSPDKLARRER